MERPARRTILGIRVAERIGLRSQAGDHFRTGNASADQRCELDLQRRVSGQRLTFPSQMPSTRAKRREAQRLHTPATLGTTKRGARPSAQTPPPHVLARQSPAAQHHQAVVTKPYYFTFSVLRISRCLLSSLSGLLVNCGRHATIPQMSDRVCRSSCRSACTSHLLFSNDASASLCALSCNQVVK